MNINEHLDKENNSREFIPKNQIDITGSNLYAIIEKSKNEDKSLLFFKGKTDILIKDLMPLIQEIKNNKSFNRQNISVVKLISKWWVTYLYIVEEVYEEKQYIINWESSSNGVKWFSEIDCNILTETLDAFENHQHQDYNHWKNLLWQTCCRMSKSLLKNFEYKNKKIKSFTNDVL